MSRRGILGSIVVVALTLRAAVSFAAVLDPALSWKTIKTKHFAIHYHNGTEEAAYKLTGITEEVYDILSEKFDAHPWGRTEVVVVDNHDIANGLTLVIPYNMVIVRTATPLPESTLGDYDEWLRLLFMHEYVHVLHITQTGYPAKALKFIFGKLMAPNGLTPGWVTEGMATYFETSETKTGRGRSAYTDMLLRTDILNDRFLHLDQMAGTQYDWPSWQAQYLYGEQFLQYLAETYGEEKLIEFSKKYGSSLRFFMLNSQAKKVWKKELTPEEEKLCSEEHWTDRGTYQTKKTYPEICDREGKTFYKLWEEWKASLQTHYTKVAEDIKSKGLQDGELYLKPEEGESFSTPTLSPDGSQLAYMATSVHHFQELRLRDQSSGKERVLMKKRDVVQMSFSPDGKHLLVAILGKHKHFNQFFDIHEIEIESGKTTQLTQGARARDPDYSPDGNKIAAVRQQTMTSELAIYDPEKESWKSIFEADQIDHPRWVNQDSIVASVHKDGRRDLWMIDTQAKSSRRILDDTSMDDRPAVTPSGTIYFASDRTGITNIYRYDPGSKSATPVTNVLTGAFAPTVSPDGEILYQYYNGKGYEIRKLGKAGSFSGKALSSIFDSDPLGGSPNTKSTLFGRGSSDTRFAEGKLGSADVGASEEGEALSESSPSEGKYNPFRKLFIPRYLQPNFVLIDESVFLSATVRSFDPLFWHSWYAGVTYRSDNNFVGYHAGYAYSRHIPVFNAGISDFVVNYGDVFRLGTDFFEERRRAFAGVSLPYNPHRFVFQYFFEDRSEQSGLPPGVTLPTLGNYAGLYGSYSYTNVDATTGRISRDEEGTRFNVNIEITDSIFGSTDTIEDQIFWGDVRHYFKMPYSHHHVVAVRAAGGAAFGDPLLQGNFVLGGDIGESSFTTTSTRLFTLRGLPLATFSRNRAWVASAEYRLPLISVQRGLGTTPFALNNMHLGFFADIGDAFNSPSFQPLLGLGAEIRGDFILGYHLPFQGRLGYGVIVTNRDRIVGINDAITGADARNGVLILAVGSSF